VTANPPDWPYDDIVTAHSPSVSLLETEPDIGRFLTSDERIDAGRILLPVKLVPNGPFDACGTLEAAGAFGALVFAGMLLERRRIGDRVGMRLLGPGDVISLTREPRSSLFSYSGCRVVAPMRVALLGHEMLLAVRRWPALLSGLHVHVAEQSDRLEAQLVICQLPRVDERLLAIMWLLAESWGHVTPLGTTLPLDLTHAALGGLVGARRSTVTLALGELADSGAVIRQRRGWLLVQAPATALASVEKTAAPRLSEDVADARAESGPHEQPTAVDTRSELFETVKRLRFEHLRNRDRTRAQLERFQSFHRHITARRSHVSERRTHASP